MNSDQINVGDFDDYLPSVMMWDEEARCWINVTMEGGNLVVDISDCTRGNTASSGIGDSGGGGSSTSNSGFTLFGGSSYPSTPYFFGNWSIAGVTSSGMLRLHRPLLDANGNPIYGTTGPLYQVTLANNPNGTTSNSGSDSSDPLGNSTSTWPNSYDPLHGNFGGGGAGSPSNNSNTSDTNEGDVVGVLAPTH